MLDVFSTREIAIGIYLLLIIIFVFSRKKIRPAAINVIKCALSIKLVIPFIFILIYSGVLVTFSASFSFWKWIYLKDILLWVIFAGVPLCYNATSRSIEQNYFSKMVIENLKFSVLVEYFLSSFTFSIFAELVLQLVLFFLIMMQAISKTKEEYKSVSKLLDWIIAILGIWIMSLTLKQAVNTYTEHGTVDYVVTFMIPIVLSVFYVPFAYLMAIYSSYETLFVRMSFKEPDNKNAKQKHKQMVLKSCGLSLKKIRKFNDECVKRMYTRMSENDFEDIIFEFKKKK